MKTIYNTVILLPILLIALVTGLFGCKNDNNGSIVPAATQGLNITIEPSVMLRSGTVPGDDAFNENKIDRVDVFFFQGGNLKLVVRHETLQTGGNTNTWLIPYQEAMNTSILNNTATVVKVIVNGSNSFNPTTLTEFDNLALNSANFAVGGGLQAQDNFVMVGELSLPKVSLAEPNLGIVKLKRAAVKTTFKLTSVALENYSFVDSKSNVRLVQLNPNGKIGMPLSTETTGLSTTAQIPLIKVGSGNDEYWTVNAPYYTYPRQWVGMVGDKDTYYHFTIVLLNTVTNKEEIYTYIVPIAPQPVTVEQAQDANFMALSRQLHANHYYEVELVINMTGNPEQEPVTLSGSYKVYNWSTRELVAQVSDTKYLFVSENNIVMPGITTYRLTFKSSSPTVTLKPGSLKATYTYVPNQTGVETTVNVAANQMPTVTVDANVEGGNIQITSPIPTNYLPKDIEFEIINADNLTQKVVVRQYPDTYFTQTRGTKSWMVISGTNGWGYRETLPNNLNNPYMYCVTTTAPDGNYIWGFPPVDSQGQTQNSVMASNMISPKFEMASQFGASFQKSYTQAQAQCRQYREYYKAADGTEQAKTGWRLPTEAEIRYIDALQYKLQSLGLNANLVMTGAYYWDAYSSNGAYKMQGGSQGSSTSAYTRCIRDIKE